MSREQDTVATHLEAIRNALYSAGRSVQTTGKAAVMVGAGFSRNAESVRTDGKTFPTWAQLARPFVDMLCASADSECAKRLYEQAASPGGFLRLTDHFSALFGRTAVDRLLVDNVPDRLHRPGALHTLLLSLPWSDVFTTNYDTLLEKATEGGINRRYDIVRTQSELSGSVRPRIVKLHGSVPSHMPFVVTGEDYRTYPQRFSLFVNTIQQSLIENLFCLLGFSGDDPNFLQWIGWVRDRLGENMPKVYLVGVLNLDPGQEQHLSCRLNVVPVDLGKLALVRNLPPAVQHYRALECFLRFLSANPSFLATSWPTPVPEPIIRDPCGTMMPHTNRTPGFLPPGPNPPRIPAWVLGKAHPGADFVKELKALSEYVDSVRIWVDVFGDNLDVYPDWVSVPTDRMRAALEKQLKGRGGDLAALLAIAHGLDWGRRLNRREFGKKKAGDDPDFALAAVVKALEGDEPRLADGLCSSLYKEALVSLIHPLVQGWELALETPTTDRGVRAPLMPELDAWLNESGKEPLERRLADQRDIEIRLFRLRLAREGIELGRFERELQILQTRTGMSRVDFEDTLCHEEGLFRLAIGDYEQVRKVLDQWPRGGSKQEPLVRVWRGALYFELGQVRRGERLVRKGHQRIVQATNPREDDYHMLSREGWLLWYLHEIACVLEKAGPLCSETADEGYDDALYRGLAAIDERLATLAQVLCDPTEGIERFQEDLVNEEYSRPACKSDDIIARAAKARRFLRLLDRIGIPYSLCGRHIVRNKALLASCAALWADGDHRSAVGALLRLAPADPHADNPLPQSWVADLQVADRSFWLERASTALPQLIHLRNGALSHGELQEVKQHVRRLASWLWLVQAIIEHPGDLQLPGNTQLEAPLRKPLSNFAENLIAALAALRPVYVDEDLWRPIVRCLVRLIPLLQDDHGWLIATLTALLRAAELPRMILPSGRLMPDPVVDEMHGRSLELHPGWARGNAAVTDDLRLQIALNGLLITDPRPRVAEQGSKRQARFQEWGLIDEPPAPGATGSPAEGTSARPAGSEASAPPSDSKSQSKGRRGVSPRRTGPGT